MLVNNLPKIPIFEIVQVSIAAPYSVRKKGVNEYPFGMEIKERTWSDSSFSYRFGFNGYEREDEVSGEGSVIDFGARIYDSRLGSFFSTDPIVYPYWSTYQYELFRNYLKKKVEIDLILPSLTEAKRIRNF